MVIKLAGFQACEEEKGYASRWLSMASIKRQAVNGKPLFLCMRTSCVDADIPAEAIYVFWQHLVSGCRVPGKLTCGRARCGRITAPARIAAGRRPGLEGRRRASCQSRSPHQATLSAGEHRRSGRDRGAGVWVIAAKKAFSKYRILLAATGRSWPCTARHRSPDCDFGRNWRAGRAIWAEGEYSHSGRYDLFVGGRTAGFCCCRTASTGTDFVHAERLFRPPCMLRHVCFKQRCCCHLRCWKHGALPAYER